MKFNTVADYGYYPSLFNDFYFVIAAIECREIIVFPVGNILDIYIKVVGDLFIADLIIKAAIYPEIGRSCLSIVLVGNQFLYPISDGCLQIDWGLSFAATI